MDNSEVIKLLTLLAEIQKDSAPIELSIGCIDKVNHIHHGYIVIKSAPPVVVQKLISHGYILNIEPQGVTVGKL